jgi:RNA polymerase sigma factor (sigma-70 family)
MAMTLGELVSRARRGEIEAYGAVVDATQAMVRGVTRSVLRDPALAEDAAQEAFLRAFHRLGELDDTEAFAGWLRRIAVTVSLNMRRTRRVTLLQLDDLPEVPVLDEHETSWTDLQRQRLAGALLTLTGDERRICDRRYHGNWTVARLAADAGIEEAAMRKRLQRIREKLRKEIEVSEQRAMRAENERQDFPARIVELLARPRLADLPENPVGQVVERLRSV